MSTESATDIDLSLLPPCRASLLKHCMRSSYQTFIWKHALVAFFPVPSPDGCGWTVSGNDIEVDWISDIVRKQLVDVLEVSTHQEVGETESEDFLEVDDVVNNIVDVISDDEDDDSVVEPRMT